MAYNDPGYMGEEFGIDLKFVEQRIRGSNQIRCMIIAEDENEPPNIDTIEAGSWVKITQAYPSLKDVLSNFLMSEHWRADVPSGPGKRRLYIENISGNEGLYDFDPELNYFVDWEDVRAKEIVCINNPFGVSLDDVEPNHEEIDTGLMVSFDGGICWSKQESIALRLNDAPTSKDESVDLVVEFEGCKSEINMKILDRSTGAIIRQAILMDYDLADIVG